MTKKGTSHVKEKQWLNIIIVVISAMILAFSLLGKFMNGGLDSHSSEAAATPILNAIDFGPIKITHSANDGWQPDPYISLGKNTPQASNSHITDYSKIAEQWQAILTQRRYQSVPLAERHVNKTYFVQLYFVEQTQPLIVKIELVTVKEMAKETSPQALITFVTSNWQILETGDFINRLLPQTVIEG